jgi:hypothetical protein
MGHTAPEAAGRLNGTQAVPAGSAGLASGHLPAPQRAAA